MNAPLLKALLCAALYPQVMTMEPPKPKKGKEIKAEALKFKIREEGSPDPVRDTPAHHALNPPHRTEGHYSRRSTSKLTAMHRVKGAQ